jgi:Phosphomannomutase
LLTSLRETGRPLSEVAHVFEPVPQLLKNVRFTKTDPLEKPEIQEKLKKVEADLEGRGRLVVRKSGTEPLIRVMAEGDDAHEITSIVDQLCADIAAAG